MAQRFRLLISRATTSSLVVFLLIAFSSRGIRRDVGSCGEWFRRLMMGENAFVPFCAAASGMELARSIVMIFTVIALSALALQVVLA